jgi:hypothetical protein
MSASHLIRRPSAIVDPGDTDPSTDPSSVRDRIPAAALKSAYPDGRRPDGRL